MYKMFSFFLNDVQKVNYYIFFPEKGEMCLYYSVKIFNSLQIMYASKGQHKFKTVKHLFEVIECNASNLFMM